MSDIKDFEIENGGQIKEDPDYEKFCILANKYIDDLAKDTQKANRFTYSSVEELMNAQLTEAEALELEQLRRDDDLYVEGVNDGYAGVDKKDYQNEEYSRGYEVGKAAKEKEERFREFKAKLAAYKAKLREQEEINEQHKRF